MASWCEEDDFDWCFDGLPEHGSIAISTNGCMLSPYSQRMFSRGVEELQKRKEPSHLIVCGREVSGLEKYGNVIYYPCFSQRWKERSNTPGTAYISYRKDGTFDQYIVFDANRMPIYRIDYGTYRGKKTLHVHYYKDGNSMPNPLDLKKGDPLYEKHKHLFKGVK